MSFQKVKFAKFNQFFESFLYFSKKSVFSENFIGTKMDKYQLIFSVKYYRAYIINASNQSNKMEVKKIGDFFQNLRIGPFKKNFDKIFNKKINC